MTRSWRLLPAALFGGLLLVPASAGADTYTVFSCRDPLGGAGIATGWTFATSGSGKVTNQCGAPGTLSAILDQAQPAGDSSASWRFDAPANTRIVRFTGARTTTGLTKSTKANDLAYSLETDNATLERCAPSTESSCVADLTEPVDKQGLDGAWLRFRALCTNAGDVCSGPLRVDFSGMAFGLADRIAPTVTNAAVTDDGGQSGTLGVRFAASDQGGGLYRTIVKVDGKPTATQPLAAGACTDALPTDGDPYQFKEPVPCPLTVAGATAGVGVKTLSAGPHAVEVAVEDAAGNTTNVYGPVEFPKINTGKGSSAPDEVNRALKARLRMWFVKARNRGRTLSSRYGTRVVTRGWLKDARGKGIQGARIDVYHVRNGKKRLLKTGLKSRAKGELTLILPLNVDTRRIQFVYRALRPGPATSTQSLRLTVRRNGKTYYRKAR